MAAFWRMDRRRLIASAAAALSAPAVLRAQSAPAPEFVEIATAEGRLRGVRSDGVSIFKGVRYAAPPLARYRFRAPGRLESWTGVRDALAYGAAAIQPDGNATLNGSAIAEDCLFLNIWTPATGADGRKRAVMYYLHGGGFTTGSGASRTQDGANLARHNDVVVIETNHRLGIMGYLWLGDLLGAEYDTSGNQSLFDITEGLDWTRRNVEAFGGDPHNVMVWGESGGGAKTSSIYAFRPAEKLFHKASIESGPGIRMTTRDEATQNARRVLAQLDIAPANARQLLDVPADRLLAIQMQPNGATATPLLGIASGRSNYFGSVVDGKYLPAHPFDPRAPAISADKPLIVGGNQDEATFFLRTSPDKSVFSLDEAGLRQRILQQYGPADGEALLAAYKRDMPTATPPQIAVAIQSDAFSRIGSTWIAEKKVAQRRAPVYLYRLVQGMAATIEGTNYPLGTSHALDISLKFDNSAARPNEPDRGAALTATAKNMSRYWANFAKTSTPSAEGQPAWPAYNLTQRPTMLLAPQCRVVNDPLPAIRTVWSGIMARQARSRA